MLVDQTPTLEEKIVRVLVDKPGESASNLQRLVAEDGREYSLRGVYKELKKLDQKGIVVKKKGKYALSLSWVHNFLSVADSLFDTYSGLSFYESLSPDLKDNSSWEFSHFRKLDSFLNQLMLALQQEHAGKPICLWTPYQWFHLSHGYEVNLFHRASEKTNTKRYQIVGSRTYLDKLGEQYLPKMSSVSFAPSAFEPERSKYYAAIGDHLITIYIDDETTAAMHELFNRVRSAEDVKIGEINQFFNRMIRSKLVLERNAEKAKAIKTRFSEFFGVPLAEL